MPCRDDRPEPSTAQRRSHIIAKHAIFFAGRLDVDVPLYVKEAAYESFTNASPDRLAKYICNLLKANEDILQNLPEDEDSLKLRLWWVNHKEKDRVRKLEEQEQERKDLLFADAINKLTDEEIDVLRARFRLR